MPRWVLSSWLPVLHTMSLLVDSPTAQKRLIVSETCERTELRWSVLHWTVHSFFNHSFPVWSATAFLFTAIELKVESELLVSQRPILSCVVIAICDGVQGGRRGNCPRCSVFIHWGGHCLTLSIPAALPDWRNPSRGAVTSLLVRFIVCTSGVLRRV